MGARTYLVLAGLLALAAPAVQAGCIADPFPIVKAEKAFDLYTRDHGYTKGFFTWSTPDAVAFQPQAVRIHDELAKALAEDSSEKDAPSKLRWAPYLIGMAESCDIGYDLGTWTVEGTDKAGWFFTIWEKQADGSWLWSLDGRAGTATPKDLPRAGVTAFTPPFDRTSKQPYAHVTAWDDEINTRLGTLPAAEAMGKHSYDRRDTVVLAGDMPPAFDSKAIAETLARRPQNAIWVRDGGKASQYGEFVYTYGHVTAADGTYLGHYVRVYRQSQRQNDWAIYIDLFSA